MSDHVHFADHRSHDSRQGRESHEGRLGHYPGLVPGLHTAVFHRRPFRRRGIAQYRRLHRLHGRDHFDGAENARPRSAGSLQHNSAEGCGKCKRKAHRGCSCQRVASVHLDFCDFGAHFKFGAVHSRSAFESGVGCDHL